MDLFGKFDLKTLFRIEKVKYDNLLFKLHHQVNFFVILVGVVFIFGHNYLDGNAILCLGEDKFASKYCWLHGTHQLPADLAKDITGRCVDKDQEEVENKDRVTHYYLWLPFVLGLCMALVKIPRVLWKTLCERGTMASLVGEENRNTGEKIVKRFNKLKNRSATIKYHISFVVCELLNIVMLIACFYFMNRLLNEKFSYYGTNVNTYYRNKKSNEANKALDKGNPMCNLFPTEVACNYCTGSIGGGCGDVHSALCILSNNLFNQYFFLILWFWWVFLLCLSFLGLIYRAAQMSIPSFSKFVFKTYLNTFGLDDAVDDLNLRPSEYFLLCRLTMNVKGSTMQEVLKELIPVKELAGNLMENNTQV